MKRTTATNIDDYIALYPPAVRTRLEKIRQTVRKIAPQAEEKISYQMPAFSLCGNLVYFAAYEHHIGFYPGAAGIKRFKKDLASYPSAKGSVQFPLDRAVPFGLIARIVRFRVKQNVEKYAAADAKKKRTKKRKKKS